MKTYRVVWEIDITAKNHREAAKKALAVQRDSGSIATHFEVREFGEDLSQKKLHSIDLQEVV